MIERPKSIAALDEAEASAFVKRNRRAVLATLMRNGRPQLSTVSYYVDDGRLIKITAMRSRAKIKNILRDDRVSLQCFSEPNPVAYKTTAPVDWLSYVVVEGSAGITDGDGLPAKLRELYKAVVGKHPDWDEYDRTMRESDNVIIVIRPERYYGLILTS